MNNYQLKPIGKVKNDVMWWFSDCDNQSDINTLQTEQSYKNAPTVMGVLATRSPARPNPIALTG